MTSKHAMILRFLLIWVTLCSGALAQVPSKSVNAVTLSVYAEGSPAAFRGLCYLVGGKPQAVPVSVGKRGAKFRYSGPQELVFFVEEPGTNGAAPRRVERARVTLPEAGTEVLLTLGEKDGRLAMGVIDISLAQFPVGSVMIMNYTAVPLAFKIGKQEGLAQPRRPARFGPFPASNSNIDYLAAVQNDGKWQIVLQNSYTPRENMRFILFLRGGAEPGKPTLYWINDYVAPTAVAPKKL